jgi:uncharacterized membrane protein
VIDERKAGLQMKNKAPRVHGTSRDKKRRQFQTKVAGSRRRIGRNLSLAVIGLTLLAIGYVVFSSSRSGSEGQVITSTDSGMQDAIIPIADLNGRKAKFYSYNLAGGQKVSFFVVRCSDGVIRTAFDACDVCYQSRLGYHQEGDDMVCNKCGRHFPSSRINEITGGCNPAALDRQVAGDRVIIKASDLAEGAQYFQGPR